MNKRLLGLVLIYVIVAPFALAYIAIAKTPARQYWLMALEKIEANWHYWHYAAYSLWLLVPFLLGKVALTVWQWRMHAMGVASCFATAELHFNTLIKAFRSHGSRKSRVKERSEWYHDIAKKDPAPVGLFSAAGPFPKTVSDDIIEWNEKEVQSKRRRRNDCMMTAALLARLYSCSPGGARMIIEHAKNDGKVPYIAPGIERLVKENWRMVRYVVRTYGFPRDIVMVEDGKTLRNWEVLNKLLKEN